jgi:hypothetical protein
MKGENGPRDERIFEETNNHRSTFLPPPSPGGNRAWSEKAVDNRSGSHEKRRFNLSPAMKRSEK